LTAHLLATRRLNKLYVALRSKNPGRNNHRHDMNHFLGHRFRNGTQRLEKLLTCIKSDDELLVQ
jgi:hypothetical protein